MNVIRWWRVGRHVKRRLKQSTSAFQERLRAKREMARSPLPVAAPEDADALLRAASTSVAGGLRGVGGAANAGRVEKAGEIFDHPLLPQHKASARSA